MIQIFLGLTIANLVVLATVFALGLFAVDAEDAPTTFYAMHVALGIAAGLLTLLAHLSVFTYFMATSKWLRAAADKVDLPLHVYVDPAFKRKRRAFAAAMIAIMMMMITMFSGAGADPTVKPLWPGEVHLVLGAITLGVHLICAMVEYRLIREQGALMDQALAAVNPPAGAVAQR